jgi:DNA-binding transcriptional MerR regulator/mannose-6-phosphate isomerase-like protein (cupin superfamily)
MRKVTLSFTIAQAARLLGVSPSSLRNWEQLGLITPARSQGRYRLYSSEVIEAAKRIQYLRRTKRLNLAGIVHMLGSGSRQEKPSPSGPRKAVRIGTRLLRLRHDRKLTLAQVAKRAGLSVSFVSALERGQANPSIATLQALAVLYGTNVRSFFGDHSGGERLVRPKDRKVLQPQPGVRLEQLAFGDTMMDPAVFRIAPNAGSGGSYHHEGEELLYVLQGRLEIWLDELARYVLEPGDCLYFKSTQSHRWRSLSDKETQVLWVNTPPTF